ncbi:hypothetical protein B0H19DRAFT_1230281 [Mycena capillaripes]|nr:hypothetical protein B0H19DRAFT_1230281 [Mycena capillaripes]
MGVMYPHARYVSAVGLKGPRRTIEYGVGWGCGRTEMRDKQEREVGRRRRRRADVRARRKLRMRVVVRHMLGWVRESRMREEALEMLAESEGAWAIVSELGTRRTSERCCQSERGVHVGASIVSRGWLWDRAVLAHSSQVFALHVGCGVVVLRRMRWVSRRRWWCSKGVSDTVLLETWRCRRPRRMQDDSVFAAGDADGAGTYTGTRMLACEYNENLQRDKMRKKKESGVWARGKRRERREEGPGKRRFGGAGQAESWRLANSTELRRVIAGDDGVDGDRSAQTDASRLGGNSRRNIDRVEGSYTQKLLEIQPVLYGHMVHFAKIRIPF